jgi:hypothetical protein
LFMKPRNSTRRRRFECVAMTFPVATSGNAFRRKGSYARSRARRRRPSPLSGQSAMANCHAGRRRPHWPPEPTQSDWCSCKRSRRVPRRAREHTAQAVARSGIASPARQRGRHDTFHILDATVGRRTEKVGNAIIKELDQSLNTIF